MSALKVSLPRYLRLLASALLFSVVVVVPSYAREVIFRPPQFFLGAYKHNTIAIEQDASGAMWLGTSAGMVRFDGRNMTPFEAGGEEGLAKGQIVNIMTNVDDRLWIHTGNTIQHFDSAAGAWVTPDPLQDLVIEASASGPRRVWFSTQTGLHLYRPQLNDVVKLSGDMQGFDLGTFSHLVESPARNLLAITESQIFHLKPNGDATLSVEALPLPVGLEGSRLNSPAYDPFRNVFLITSSSGAVAQVGADDLKVELVIGPEEFQPFSDVRDLLIESDRLWFATGYGAFYVEPDSWTPSPASTVSAGAGNSVAQAIFRSADGIYWLSLIDSGTLIGRSFEADVINSSTSGLPDDNIQAIAADDQHYFVGTTSGLHILNRDSLALAVSVTSANQPKLKDSVVVSVLADAGNVYIGTFGGGAYVYDMSSGELSALPFDPSGATNALRAPGITRIIRLSSGHILLSTFGGGVSLFKDGVVFNPKQSTENYQGYIFDTHELSDGRVLISTGEGMALLDASHSVVTMLETVTLDDMGSEVSVPRPLYAHGFAELPDGRLISGSRSLGLIEIQLRGTKAILVSQLEEIQPVSHVERLSDGEVWAATTEGLQRVDIKSLQMKPLPPHFGLSSLDPVSEAVIGDVDGRLLFGTDMGVFKMGLDSQMEAPPLIKVALSQVLVDGRSVPPSDAETGLKVQADTSIVQVSFFGAEYLYPSETDFSYRVIGITDQWQDLGNDATVTLTELSSGNYALEVAAKGLSGEWNRQALRLPISVALPLWRTPAFLAIYLFLFTVITLFFIRLQRSKQAIHRSKISDLTLAVQHQARSHELERINGLKLLETLERSQQFVRKNLHQDIAKLRDVSRSVSSGQNDSAEPKLYSDIQTIVSRAEANIRGLLRLMADQTSAGTSNTVLPSIPGAALVATELPAAEVLSEFIDFIETAVQDAVARYHAARDNVFPILDLSVGSSYRLSALDLTQLIDGLFAFGATIASEESQIIFRAQQTENLLILSLEEFSSSETDRAGAEQQSIAIREHLVALAGDFSITPMPEGEGCFIEATIPAIPDSLYDISHEGWAYFLTRTPYAEEAYASVLLWNGFRGRRLPSEPTFSDDQTRWVVVEAQVLADMPTVRAGLDSHSRVIVVGNPSGAEDYPPDWHVKTTPLVSRDIKRLLTGT
ncbi:MAG: ligand-binding sensor domain-containing protein [Henriciella sp.]